MAIMVRDRRLQPVVPDDAAARAADDDGRFGVYDWLGYRLDGIVQALDDADGEEPDDPDGVETHR